MSTTAPFSTALNQALASAPKVNPIPPMPTPGDARMAEFRKICPAQFQVKLDRTKLKNPAAFDRVATWDGTFPGPLACGPTGTSKTWAGWVAIGRLFVREKKVFAWFPVKRLISCMEDGVDPFAFQFRACPILMVDDVDKINWAFESDKAALFEFYDWAYRVRRPVLTTTNQTREWWGERMGDAFVRRLFDEGSTVVDFHV